MNPPSPEAVNPTPASVARSDRSDAALVEAFVSEHDNGALVELVRRHQISVFRKFSLELADPDLAEGAAELLFVVASQRLAEWPRDTDLRAWLFELADDLKDSLDQGPAPSDSPKLVDPAVFFRHAVHRAVRSLSEEARTLLLAVDLEGKSPEEIAERMDLPLVRVTESLTEAREAFRSALEASPHSERKAAGAVVRLGPGDIVDQRYQIRELLGKGGMASVFKAEHLGIHRMVAVKTLQPNRQTQAMVRERFVREAEVLGRLQHPNFVDVSDFGELKGGVAYLVMELLQGESLAAHIHRRGRLTPERALDIAIEVARGLSFAHELGVIHRDIKPDNIVVLPGNVREGFAKILDLGVATSSDADAEEPGLYGTPTYMAPEQIAGGRIDGRVDIYATGVTLFEMLTGQPPFQGGSIQYVLAQHLTFPHPKLKEVFPDLERDDVLQPLVDRCLAKSPEARFRSATELLQALERARSVLGGSSVDIAADGLVEPQADAPAQPANRRAWLVWCALALALAAAVVWWRYG